MEDVVEPSFEERCAEINEYLARGGSVCSFATELARTDGIHYADVPNVSMNDRTVSDGICRTLVKFMPSGQRVLLFVFGDTKKNHDTERKRANRFFLELMIGFNRIKSPQLDPEYARSLLMDRNPGLAEAIRIPGSRYLGNLPTTQGRMFWFAMSPLYDEHHPRFAPHSIMLGTYWNDIYAAQEHEPSRVAQIGRSMALGIARTVCPAARREDLISISGGYEMSGTTAEQDSRIRDVSRAYVGKEIYI